MAYPGGAAGRSELVSRLRRVVPPERVTTSGPGYDTGRTLWNGAVDRRPAVVLRCGDPADVRAGVRIAGEVGAPLAVRAGGHGWTGSAVADDGLTIDIGGLRRVTVDAGAKTADVRGGATAGDLMAAAEPRGLVAVTGTVGAVGVAGLSLGGGYGPLSGRFGLAVDNVLAVDVVLADGTEITADADHEPDLFWALRGGGGNFGVVTSVRVALHTVPAVLGGVILYPWAQAGPVLAALAETALTGPDELTLQSGIVTGPTGEPVVFAAPTWCGEPARGERVLAALTRLGDPVVHRIAPMTLTELLRRNGDTFPDGRHAEVRPRNLPGLTPRAVDALVAGGESMTSALSAVSLHALHGAAARVPVEDTAFGIRAPHLMAENIALWEPSDHRAAEHRDWARDLSEALSGEALPGGYVNLLAPDETDQIAHAYGPNRDRLLAVKRQFDPAGVFSATPLPPDPGPAAGPPLPPAPRHL